MLFLPVWALHILSVNVRLSKKCCLHVHGWIGDAEEWSIDTSALKTDTVLFSETLAPIDESIGLQNP